MALQREVVVFAKHPTPGLVKTRLAARIGNKDAAELHRHCLAATIACVGRVPEVRLIVAVSPDDADLGGLVPDGAVVEPQGGGNLGSRLTRVLGNRFAAGCNRLVVVGSDCPQMQPSDIESAFGLLDGHEVVIGPAIDGGYYLLGLRQARPELFAAIDWSTPAVAAQTRERARASGLRPAELPPRRDIDTLDDLIAVRDEIAEGDARLAEFRRFVDSILKDGGLRDPAV